MANSKYDYHKLEEKSTDLRFNSDTYIIIRIDGDKFHQFCSQHNFHKPNDKRALDLMVASAKHLMKTYRGDIPLAFGHSDEFSFMIKSTSNILSRRIFKITSMLPVVFATYYNNSWPTFFDNPAKGISTKRTYDAWFDARPKEYPNYRTVIDYFRWRQVDCHINNLYNTTLHCLTGRYVRHEIQQMDFGAKDDDLDTFLNDNGTTCMLKRTPITNWITDKSKFLSSNDATDKLSGTVSSDKHDIMFLEYKVNYNNELEQFKKGTVIVDTQKNFDGKNEDVNSIKHYHIDLIRNNSFWKENSHIFPDLAVFNSTDPFT